jgi:hypothetical protein
VDQAASRHKAACGGDYEFFLNVVWPWREDNAENAGRGIEEMEGKWNSFHDSQLGADYVYDIASSFGFMEGKYARALEIFADREPPPMPGTAAEYGSADGVSGAPDPAGTCRNGRPSVAERHPPGPRARVH